MYIGISRDVHKRLKEHNSRKVRSTKAYVPWELAHTESFPEKTSARKHENFLKRNYQARRELFEHIGKTLSDPIV